VLLRPLAIRRHHSDFDLKLHGTFTINPELVVAARTHFGLVIDGRALAELAYDGGVFKPQPVIDHLRALTAHVDTFTVQPRLVVSTFADASSPMSRDAESLDHPILNALAGHESDREDLSIVRAPAPPVSSDERPPAADRLLLDADAEQEAVLARIAAGQSLAVHTLPGTGGTQTVINAVGELVRAGKRVLVVSARRSTLEGVRHRLAGIGLPGWPSRRVISTATSSARSRATRRRNSPRWPTSTMRSCACAPCCATIATRSRSGIRASRSLRSRHCAPWPRSRR
jgi:hypothetical protein